MKSSDLICRHQAISWRAWRVVGVALLCLCSLASIGVFGQTHPAEAPAAPAATMNNFPLISVRAPCPGVTPEKPRFQLAEDGQIQAIQAVQTETVPIPSQTIIFVDLYAKATNLVGPVGDALFQMHNAAIAQTTPQALFAVFAPGGGKTLKAVVPWTADTVKVVNTVRGLDADNPWQPSASDPTPLLALLHETLQTLPKDNAVRQRLIVFSDGADAEKDKLFQAVIDDAQTHHISIDTVMLKGPQSNAQRLQALAAQTAGDYYPNLDEGTLAALWQKLFAPSLTCILTYRTTQAYPTQVLVSQIISGLPYTTVIPLPRLDVAPPMVTVAITAPGEIYTRTYRLVSNQAPTQTFVVNIAWQFPQYPLRKATLVTYRMQGATAMQGATVPAPGTTAVRIELPLVALPLGAYLIEATVKDDVQLTGQSSVAFGVAPTPIPTATPTPTFTPTPTPTPTATPTATSTPELLYRALDLPPQRPATERLLLLLAGFSLPFWLALALFMIQRRKRRLGATSLSPLTRLPTPIQAVLNREEVDERVPNQDARRLRQVVKLTAQTKLPDSLYLDPAVRNTSDELAQFGASLEAKYGKFRLIPNPTVWLIVERNKEKFQVSDAIDLQHNDLIQFGKVQYRFYEIMRDPVQENGHIATAVVS